MKVAKDFITKHNKPKTTRISRIPQGVEDSLFKSYFEGYNTPMQVDYSVPAGTQPTSTSTQDISKIAAQHHKAADLVLDKLGADYTKTIYVLEDNLTKPV